MGAMKVWNVIETSAYTYNGDVKSTASVATCVSEDVARKVRLDMERKCIEDLYEGSDETEERIEELVAEAQMNHEFVFADCETTTWEIEESEMCYE